MDGTLDGYKPHAGDFNGDGIPDILWSRFDPGANQIWMGTGNGNFTVVGGLPAYSRFGPILGDFNRDGKTDIWWARTENSIKQWTSKGDGTFTITVGPWRPSPANKYSLASLGDGNGDGRSDVGWLFHSSTWGLEFWFTNADGITIDSKWNSPCSLYPGWSGCAFTPGTADFNGDGFSDILWVTTKSVSGKGVNLMLGDGSGTFTRILEHWDSSLHDYAPYFVDINGDGKTDIIWDHVDDKGKSKGQRRLWLGKGDGTFVMQTNLNGKDGTLSGYRAQIGDFNGDGIPDILWVQESSGGDSGGGEESAINLGSTGQPGLAASSHVLWLGKGDGTFTDIPNFGGLDGTVVNYKPVLSDFNGDGKTDVLWYSGGQRVLWLSDGVATDLMTSITSGIGAKVAVTYKSMTDSTVYVKDSSPPGGLVDIVDLQGPMALVSQVEISNAIGGTVKTDYAYAGAKIEHNGRGFLGFRQMTVAEVKANPLVVTTTYRQDFPYIALVADETKKIGTVTLNTTTHAYGATLLGGTRFQPFLVQSQAKSTDLDGYSVLPTITSTYKHDTFGNATEIVVSATDGFSKTTTNIYSNDTTKWLLGRLTRATVTSLITTPGPPPAQPPTEVQVGLFSSTNNFKLWDYLLANGLAKAGTPGTWTVTIASNVLIGSSSTSLPAFDTGSFPAGSVLKIINNGTIVGAGGNGGNGGVSYWDGEGGGGCIVYVPTTPGAAGGPALKAQVAVAVVNNGKIWGGGGGGGGSVYASVGGSGGGGAGSIPGAGGVTELCGDGGCTKYWPGSPGALTNGGAGGVVCDTEGSGACFNGGAGGNPGLAGKAGVAYPYACTPGGTGGAAGPATIGNSFITWTVTGDRKGPLN